MTIIPAIDIIDGEAVRLSTGDYAEKKVYSSDPLQIALNFEAVGLTRLHIVDLDGAKARKLCNLKVLSAIAEGTRLEIDFGGGITSGEDVRSVLNAGARQCAIGSVAVRQRLVLREWIREFGKEKFLIGADALHEKVRISGWLEDGGISVFEFISNLRDMGIHEFFCTDISKDGMLQGPAIGLYQNILMRFPGIELIASGGISSMDDIRQLYEIGCAGAIVGKAIYENKITLQELSEFESNVGKKNYPLS